MHGSSPAIETNHQSGDCWNWKDNSDLKSEARNVRMGSSPISPIGDKTYETKMQTIMMVTAANQLYTLAGVAQLVENILIEQVTFNHRVERSNRFTSTNEGQKASTFW